MSDKPQQPPAPAAEQDKAPEAPKAPERSPRALNAALRAFVQAVVDLEERVQRGRAGHLQGPAAQVIVNGRALLALMDDEEA